MAAGFLGRAAALEYSRDLHDGFWKARLWGGTSDCGLGAEQSGTYVVRVGSTPVKHEPNFRIARDSVGALRIGVNPERLFAHSTEQRLNPDLDGRQSTHLEKLS